MVNGVNVYELVIIDPDLVDSAVPWPIVQPYWSIFLENWIACVFWYGYKQSN